MKLIGQNRQRKCKETGLVVQQVLKFNLILLVVENSLSFTTCIETIYGITFMVLAPDGDLVQELMPRIQKIKKK